MTIRMLTIEEMTEEQKMRYEIGMDVFNDGGCDLAKLVEVFQKHGIIIAE